MLRNSKYKSIPAVVVGLQHLTALGTVRSLAKENVPVIGITSQPESPIAKTNKCQKVYCQDVNSEILLETLLDVGKSLEHRAVLFPTGDAQVALISENREKLLPFYRFGLPEKKIVTQLLQKTEFSLFADKHGFKIPKTLVVDKSTDIKSCLKSVKYPCILKPENRTAEWQKQNPGNKIHKIPDETTLLKEIPSALQCVDSLVLQEWIEGKDSDVYFCLMYFDDHSEAKATFVGRKIRQWLPEIGSTACAEKVFNKTVLDESLRLFKSVNYKGLGSVEFKFEKKSSQFFITEPTVGRPNLQSYIAVANGINIPYIAYSNLIGNPICQLDRDSENGAVKWINEQREFDSARFYMKRGSLTTKDWYQSIRGPKSYALFSFLDPLPFIATILGKKKKERRHFLKFFLNLQKIRRRS